MITVIGVEIIYAGFRNIIRGTVYLEQDIMRISQNRKRIDKYRSLDGFI